MSERLASAMIPSIGSLVAHSNAAPPSTERRADIPCAARTRLMRSKTSLSLVTTRTGCNPCPRPRPVTRPSDSVIKGRRGSAGTSLVSSHRSPSETYHDPSNDACEGASGLLRDHLSPERDFDHRGPPFHYRLLRK